MQVSQHHPITGLAQPKWASSDEGDSESRFLTGKERRFGMTTN